LANALTSRCIAGLQPDEITTSDPDDLLPLVAVTGAHVELRRA